MFPNNFLHFRKFRDLNFDEESAKFLDILSKSTSEQDFQRYIKENKKWFIPGSIFLDYNFGHHDAYLFPEQKLGTDYIADYMLIGKLYRYLSEERCLRMEVHEIGHVILHLNDASSFKLFCSLFIDAFR